MSDKFKAIIINQEGENFTIEINIIKCTKRKCGAFGAACFFVF